MQSFQYFLGIWEHLKATVHNTLAHGQDKHNHAKTGVHKALQRPHAPFSTDGSKAFLPPSQTLLYLTNYFPKATVQSLFLPLNHPTINQMTFYHFSTQVPGHEYCRGLLIHPPRADFFKQFSV